MRVIPLTSLLSHKGRGSRSPNRDYILSLDVKNLFKHLLSSTLYKTGLKKGMSEGY